MKILLPSLCVWLASLGCALADWEVVRSERQNPPNEPLEHREVALTDETRDEHATMELAIFTAKAATLQLIDQPATPRRDLAAVMMERHALAGVNGGYFDPEDAPVGLLVSAGKKIAPLSTARLLGGVLFSTATRVDIVRASHFKMSGKVLHAVQCGPLLLERGATVAGLNDTRSARRTFAAITGTGEVALGFCSSISLGQLGKILALPRIAGGEMKFTRALNLDGGSSSGFWVSGAKEAFSISEQKTVRDFVAVVRKSDR